MQLYTVNPKDGGVEFTVKKSGAGCATAVFAASTVILLLVCGLFLFPLSCGLDGFWLRASTEPIPYSRARLWSGPATVRKSARKQSMPLCFAMPLTGPLKCPPRQP